MSFKKGVYRRYECMSALGNSGVRGFVLLLELGFLLSLSDLLRFFPLLLFLKFFALICQDGIILPSTLGLAISARTSKKI